MHFKPQDILFIAVLAILLFKRDPKLFVWTGLASLVISIPLFAKWIFFTAERLVFYGFVFILIAVLLNLWRVRHNKSSTFFNSKPKSKLEAEKVLDK